MMRCLAGRGRASWRGRAVAGGVALALAAALVRLPAGERRDSASFPRVAAASLAHLLADFTAHPHGARPWRLLDERGNYTWWWYRVAFPCGERCAGEASVAASSPSLTALTSLTSLHRVTQHITLCTSLPLLPWLTFCDELEVESVVRAAEGEGEGEGSVVEERARAQCSAGRVVSGACGALLAGHRAAHRAALAARAAHLAHLASSQL